MMMADENDTLPGEKKRVISSGNPELDGKMGDGIPIGSLTLIEGTSGAGKSVLSQQIIWGSLREGFSVSLFTSENSVKSLISQMQSIDLDILDFLLLGRLRVFTMELSRLGSQAPSTLARAMIQEPRRLPTPRPICTSSAFSNSANACAPAVRAFSSHCTRTPSRTI